MMLQRYSDVEDNMHNPEMVKDLNGNWVWYDDIKAIIQENDDLHKIMELAHERIREMTGRVDACDDADDNTGTSLTEEEYDNQMRGEIQRHGGG